jgi:hypothetical protein
VSTVVNNQHTSLPQYWIWLTVGLFVLWLLTLVLWYKHVSALKAGTKHQSTAPARNTQSEQALWKSLEKALNKNLSSDAQKYLPLWLGYYIQDKNASLEQSLNHIGNHQLTEAVNTLLASRYAKEQSPWQSTELHQILRKMRKNGTIEPHTKHNLSPLYPIS